MPFPTSFSRYHNRSNRENILPDKWTYFVFLSSIVILSGKEKEEEEEEATGNGFFFVSLSFS